MKPLVRGVGDMSPHLAADRTNALLPRKVRATLACRRGHLMEEFQCAQEHRLMVLQRHPGWWLATYALLLLIQISPWWYPTPDSVAYLSIARSIANGHGLRNLGSAHIAYPPGYPLLMSLAFIGRCSPFLTISIVNWVMALVFLLGLYRWTSRLVPEAAPLLTGLTMLNATFWTYYHRTLAELAFLTVMIWTIIALDRAREARSVRDRGLFALIGCGLAVYLSMIREVGAVFVAAFVMAIGVSIVEGRQKVRDGVAIAVAVAIPALLAVSAFVAYDQSTFEGSRSFLGTHLSGFLDPREPLLQRICEGLLHQISAIGRLIIPGMFKAYGHSWLNVNTLVYVSVVTGIAIGWLRLIRQHRGVFVYTLPLYFILYVAWGFDADTRYMLPMLPILIVSVWKLVEPFRSWRLSVLAGLLILHGVVAIGYWIGAEIPGGLECSRQWPGVNRIVSTIESEPGPVATIGKIPECVRWMLSFALDRPVSDLNSGQAALLNPQWVILPFKGPEPFGFHQVAEVSTYKVLQKNQPAPASTR